ncbi:hypothetical protein, partial [Corynebacterium amycolatum]
MTEHRYTNVADGVDCPHAHLKTIRVFFHFQYKISFGIYTSLLASRLQYQLADASDDLWPRYSPIDALQRGHK